MSKSISQTWPLSSDTTKNNFLFTSKFLGATTVPYMPLEMQLVLIFNNDEAAENFLHRDMHLFLFAGSSPNEYKWKTSVTTMEKHRNRTAFTVTFDEQPINSKLLVSNVDEGASIEIRAMITFSSEKPKEIAGAFLMVTGCRFETLSKLGDTESP